MTRRTPHAPLVAVLATLFCLTACERPSDPALYSPPRAEPDQGVSFVSGFHEQEVLSPSTRLRWARQDAVLRVDVPGAGRYRVTFRPFTAFSMEKDTIEIRVNGQPAGEFSTSAFDLAEAVPTPVEITLHAGGNDLALHSSQPMVRLGENDERVAAFGLLLPVSVEPMP